MNKKVPSREKDDENSDRRVSEELRIQKKINKIIAKKNRQSEGSSSGKMTPPGDRNNKRPEIGTNKEIPNERNDKGWVKSLDREIPQKQTAIDEEPKNQTNSEYSAGQAIRKGKIPLKRRALASYTRADSIRRRRKEREEQDERERHELFGGHFYKDEWDESAAEFSEDEKKLKHDEDNGLYNC